MSKKKQQDKLKQKLTRNTLAIFRKSGQQKLNYKQLSAKLSINKPHERMLVSSILNQLSQDGIIKEVERGKYRSVKKEKLLVEGNIDITRNGTGYLSSDFFDTDIYIAPRYTGKAIHNDLVLVEVDPNKRKPEGRVIKVVKRNRDTFVGLIEAGSKQVFVIPDDFKINIDFYIPIEQLNGAKEGDKVIVKMTDWPERAKNPFAKVITVLGKSGDHNVEMHAIHYE